VVISTSVSNLPLHYAGNKLDPDTKQLVTIYNHLPYFQNKGKPKHKVLLDEVHALVVDAYRDDTIKAMVRSLSFFKKVVCLTGTLIESKFFNHYYLIQGSPVLPYLIRIRPRSRSISSILMLHNSLALTPVSSNKRMINLSLLVLQAFNKF